MTSCFLLKGRDRVQMQRPPASTVAGSAAGYRTTDVWTSGGMRREFVGLDRDRERLGAGRVVGDDDWYLGSADCRTRLTGRRGGKCPDCCQAEGACHYLDHQELPHRGGTVLDGQ
jgi:hypothetical protein